MRLFVHRDSASLNTVCGYANIIVILTILLPSQGVTLVFPAPDSSLEFTGRGLVSFPPLGDAIFTVQVPRDSSYEVILRLQVHNHSIARQEEQRSVVLHCL